MEKCVMCGNSYEKTFTVSLNEKSYIFDCFECAIHKLAPSCLSCGCRIIGHGVQSGEKIYCCAHCAREEGESGIKDHV